MKTKLYLTLLLAATLGASHAQWVAQPSGITAGYYAQFIDGKWILNGLRDNAYVFKNKEGAMTARFLVEKQVKPTLGIENLLHLNN